MHPSSVPGITSGVRSLVLAPVGPVAFPTATAARLRAASAGPTTSRQNLSILAPSTGLTT
jgi:hypothetical protein